MPNNPAPRGTQVSAVDQLIEAIKLRVRTARFVPGQRLIEADLMREFRLSRGPIREALRRLTAEGLVQTEPFRGASIVRMSRRQVIDLNQIREVLEGYAAAQAALHIDAHGRAAFARVLKLWSAKPASRSITYGEYNRQFHALILEQADNRELSTFVDRTRLAIFRLQFSTLLHNPGHIERSNADHARIVGAILKKDARGAELAMRVHLRHTAIDILAAPDEYFSDEPVIAGHEPAPKGKSTSGRIRNGNNSRETRR